MECGRLHPPEEGMSALRDERMKYGANRSGFTLTVEQRSALKQASLNSRGPEAAQAESNAIWEELGRRLGFDYTTVQPIPGMDDLHFSAVKVIEAAALAIAPPATRLVEYSATAAGLAELRSRIADVVYDVRSAKGMDTARTDRRECVKLRTKLEALRVELKAPALERSRLIDSEARSLTAAILALESPIDEQIKAEEQRKEAERAELARAEAARIEAIRGEIAALMRRPAESIRLTADGVKAEREKLEADRANPEWPARFDEFAPEAIFARAAGIDFLTELEVRKREEEAESARIAREAAELAERQANEARQAEALAALRREEAAIELAEREAQAAREREARDELWRREAAVAAEEQRQAEARAEADRKAAREAEEKAVSERQAAAEEERRQAAERERSEAATRAAEHRKERLALRVSIRASMDGDPWSALREIAAICEEQETDDAAARERIALVTDAMLLTEEEAPPCNPT
jgi:hypothetical protein